ncbi:MAG TPA: hypothetical protein DER40_10040 [Geobacter sp.]|nr:MAG: hypothetical protein A2X85_03680 [Geobacteraceae bacterium GWF2_54_21]HCE67834.1 hypothetical protein [Geobacter sp.]
MILHPSVIALICGSLLTSAIMLYASFFALRIIRRWDLSSGSELQLELEHRTYLISTIMACGMVFQALSLFLFIHTADSLSTLFKGAMCAAGTLNLNMFGYPLLLLKLAIFLLAGLWLIVNHSDNRGYDYPLIRVKYLLLLGITPLMVAESLLLGLYFGLMKPHVITSCCGSLFGTEAKGLAPALALIPEVPLLAVLATVVTALLISGAGYLRSGRGAALFSVLSLTAFLCGAAALVSALPVYIYALPSHHCPFCMLQREYGFSGYVYYAALLGGAVSGIGAGILQRFRRIGSLASLPAFQRSLVIGAMLLFALFMALAFWQVWFSELRLT